MRVPVGALLLALAACGGDAESRTIVVQAQAAEEDQVIAAAVDTLLQPLMTVLPAAAEEPEPDFEGEERCDPNYRPCVPIARDVDCERGGGDGPAYVRGPVRVIRRDIYRLDHDRDGIGCE